MTSYIYTKPADYTDINYSSFIEEIDAAGLTVDGVTLNGTTLTVVGTLTAPQVTTLDGVVAAHSITSIDSQKVDLRKLVLDNTVELLAQGTSFSGETVLCTRARLSYYRALDTAAVARGSLLPTYVETMDLGEVALATTTDTQNLVEAVEDRINTIMDGQHTLLVAIAAAVTQVDIDAIDDTRT